MKLKFSMKFEIKRLGHDCSKNVVEPYSNLRDLDILDVYLAQN